MVNVRNVAATAVFTAFVTAATSVFSVFIPATQGYFNVGEIMVYTSALLMGPYVGAFAGGVGSALSDLSLGYWYYAPGTLVIKGLEGLVVGYLSLRLLPQTRAGWRGLTGVLGLVVATTLAYVGVTFFTGSSSIVLGGVWGLPAFEVDPEVPALFWVAAAAVVFAMIVVLGWRVESKLGQNVLSVLAGGAVMVTGYFVYESTVLSLIAPASAVAGFLPAAEIPFNIAQALVGLAVSVPLVRTARRMMRGGASVGGSGRN